MLIMEWTVLLSSGYAGGAEHIPAATSPVEQLGGAIPLPVSHPLPVTFKKNVLLHKS